MSVIRRYTWYGWGGLLQFAPLNYIWIYIIAGDYWSPEQKVGGSRVLVVMQSYIIFVSHINMTPFLLLSIVMLQKLVLNSEIPSTLCKHCTLQSSLSIVKTTSANPMRAYRTVENNRMQNHNPSSMK